MYTNIKPYENAHVQFVDTKKFRYISATLYFMGFNEDAMYTKSARTFRMFSDYCKFQPYNQLPE